MNANGDQNVIEPRQWTCSDGLRIEGERIEAATPRARAVIAPGMGVPRGFYRRFAQYLADAGIDTLLFDYRRRPGVPMADWGRLDIEAVIADCDDRIPLFLIGHSCGGQLAGLAPSCTRLAGFAFVAAQSGHWRHWSGRGRLGMWSLGHLVIPLLAHGRYFPARRLGLFPIDVPASVVAQWGRWMRSPRYLFNPAHGLDTAAYAALARPALAYGFDDDDYAPAAAIDALLAEYPKLSVTRRQIARDDVNGASIGHMGFFREAVRDTLWRDTVEWLLAVAAQNRVGDI